MREILLTNGGIALVDDEDYATLAAHNWQRHVQGYAYRYTRRRPAKGVSILMHRVIMDAPAWLDVDHKDRDGLNNQRTNLRLCTKSENLRNQKVQTREGKSSRFKGVYLDKRRGMWVARVGGRRAVRWLGQYATEEEAAAVYNAAALVAYGAFARLNDIQACAARVVQ